MGITVEIQDTQLHETLDKFTIGMPDFQLNCNDFSQEGGEKNPGES